MSPHQLLRAATSAEHDKVDALFGRYDFTRRADYVAFLMAHARVVPALEGALADIAGAPELRNRTTLLLDDLADLDVAPPVPMAVEMPADAAEGWGMAYVMEGSRLGGRMLERSVPPSLPRRYLAAGHEAGEWRRFTRGLDETLDNAGALERATTAAVSVFALYRAAALQPTQT